MKELLGAAMPDFEPVPDRLDQVRRRAKARRDRRLAGGAAVAVLAVAVGAGVVLAQPSARDVQPAAATVCTFAPFRDKMPLPSELGDYPEGALKATFCLFDGNEWREQDLKLVGAVEQVGAEGIVRKLHSKKLWLGACLESSTAYRLVLEFEHRPPVQVALQGTHCEMDQIVSRDKLLRGTVDQAIEHFSQARPVSGVTPSPAPR